MSDQDIFEEEDKDKKKDDILTGDAPDDKTGDKGEVDQLLATIVNDDGEPKYKSTEDALKALPHAQQHIATLEKELSELKEKGNASDKLEELIDAVKQSKGSGDGEDSPTMKPEDVLGIVKEYLSDTKAAETRQNNIKTVASAFKDRFGKEASDKLYGTAADLGFNRKEINRLIANNPTAALNVLGIKPVDKKKDVVSTPGVNTAAFQDKSLDKPEKSIMQITKQSELVDAWNASKQRTLKRLGIEET